MFIKNNSEEWIAICVKLGFSLSDIKEKQEKYYFEAAGFEVAYWDRNKNVGYISKEIVQH